MEQYRTSFKSKMRGVTREKEFVHIPADLGYDELETIEVNGKRQYVIPDGRTFPSITTVLGHGKNDGIEKWKKRVGEVEANRVSKVACDRGTSLHLLVEKYIRNDAEIISGSEMPDAIAR